jgi:hypothetical protein
VYSFNGINWTALPALSSIFATQGDSIAWSDVQGLWVAGGQGGTFRIATSPDGVTWIGRTSPFTTTVSSIAYSPYLNQWVAVGSGTTAIAYSRDAVTWVGAVAVVNSIVGRHVSWSADLRTYLVSLSGGGAPISYTTATSQNGVSWTTAYAAFQPESIALGSAWNGSQFIVAGSSVTDTVEVSSDGISYTSLGTSVLPLGANGVCFGIDYSVSLVVGPTYYLSLPSGETRCITGFSRGTRCFAKYATNVTSATTGSGPAQSADIIIPQGTTFVYSVNGGRSWTSRGVPAGFCVADVTYSQQLGIWMAVGNACSANTPRNTISVDGITWNQTIVVSSGLNFASIIRSDSQGLWVAGTLPGISTSPDGIVWTARSAPFTTNNVYIAYSPTLTMWVAAGGSSSSPSIASSPDGITWTTRLSNFYTRDVKWIPYLGRFVYSPGSNAGGVTMFTSSDGISWTASSVPFSPSTNGEGGIVSNGTHVYLMGLGGSGNTISAMLSTDLVSFTSLGTTLFSSGGNGCYSANSTNWVLLGYIGSTPCVRTVSSITGAVGPALVVGGSGRCTARH